MKLTVLLIGLLVLFSSANGQGRGALRLIINNVYSKTQAYNFGIVEIYYSSTWGNICDDTYFGYNEANVICHQLAFTGVSSYGNVGSISLYGTDTNSMLLEDVDCSSSNYLVLLQCSYRSRYSTNCNDNNRDAVVVCYITKIWNSNPYSGQLRIVGGTYSNQGRLEVYCNGLWGTVCDKTFDRTDANVACRQLGYSDYSRYEYTSEYEGSSTQPIWLNYLDCISSLTTNYSCLARCEGCPSYECRTCNHKQDVSLECEFSSSYTSGPYTTLDTCRFDDSSQDNYAIGAIVGGTIAAIVFCCTVIILVITVPFCICYCLGVGIGAASSHHSTSQTTVVGTPTTSATVVSSNTETNTQNVPPTGGYSLPNHPAVRYSPRQPGRYAYPPKQY